MKKNKIISNIMISGFLNYFNNLIQQINPSAATFALKMCLTLAIGYGLAFLLNFSGSTTAITILILNSQYIGNSIDKSILRVIGTISGAVISFILIEILAQERFLFIICIGCINVLLFFMMQNSRYPYAWLICSMTILIIGFSSIENPYNTFHTVVSRTSAILLGIFSSLFVHGILLPTRADIDFEDQLRDVLSQLSKLVNIKYCTYLEESISAGQVAKSEKKIISTLPKLRETLDSASYNSDRFSRFRNSYSNLCNEIEKYAFLIFTLGDTLKNCSTYKSLKDDLQKSEVFREIINILISNSRQLVADCELARDGRLMEQSSEFKNEFQEKLSTLNMEINSKELEQNAFLAFVAMSKTLKESVLHITKIRSMLLSVESHQELYFFSSAQPEIFKTDESFKITSPRFIKSIISSLIIILASIIWIITDWPLGNRTFILLAWAISYINIILPLVPSKTILSGLFLPVIVGFLMYFTIMPQLDSFLQLVPFIILMCFPFCYIMYSSNTIKSATHGMLGAIFLVMFVNISQQQTYSFSNFVNSLIAIGGGLLTGILLISLFAYRTPEKEFKKQIVSFFTLCKDITEQLTRYKPWTEKGQSILFTARKRLLKKKKISALLASNLKYQRDDSTNKNDINSLLSSIENIVFRIDSLEHARQEFRYVSSVPSLNKLGNEMRQTIIDQLAMLENSVAKGVNVPDFPDLSEKVAQIVSALREISISNNVDSEEQKTAGNILLITGSYVSLAASLVECRTYVNNLKWQEFDKVYF